jgi:hypothetical protein
MPLRTLFFFVISDLLSGYRPDAGAKTRNIQKNLMDERIGSLDTES